MAGVQLLCNVNFFRLPRAFPSTASHPADGPTDIPESKRYGNTRIRFEIVQSFPAANDAFKRTFYCTTYIVKTRSF